MWPFCCPLAGACCPRCSSRFTPLPVMLQGCVPLPMVPLRPQDIPAFSQVTMDRVKGVFIGLVLENDQTAGQHRPGQHTQELRMLSPHGGLCTAYPTTFTSAPSPMLMVEPLITPWAFPASLPDPSQVQRPSPQPSPPLGAGQPCSHSSGDSGFSECWCPRDPGTSWDAPKDKPSNSNTANVDHQCAAERLVVNLPPLKSDLNLSEPSQDMNPAARSALNKCGFYYPGLSNDSARRALRTMAVGTFLLRDSSHPGYMLSLTAVTPRGTTSVRLEYREGMFRVDTASWRGDIPAFSCPIRLLQYYISTPCVFTESSGRRDTKVLLHRPLRHTVLSLADLARRTVHKNTRPEDLNWLALPARTRKYLIEYPYWL